MQASNPYESPNSTAGASPSRTLELFTAGLWVVIPFAFMIGVRWTRPIFSDFGVELPRVTVLLFAWWVPVLLFLFAATIIFIVLMSPATGGRRRFTLSALISGFFFVIFTLISLLVPLISLMQNLS